MIVIDEDDVRAIANRRYRKDKNKHLWTAAGLSFILVIVIMMALNSCETSDYMMATILIPLVGLMGYAWYLNRGCNEYTQRLVKEWKEEGVE